MFLIFFTVLRKLFIASMIGMNIGGLERNQASNMTIVQHVLLTQTYVKKQNNLYGIFIICITIFT